jgi:hypothetical protein
MMNNPKTQRPTDKELAKCQATLSVSQRPEDFLKEVERIGAKIATNELWGNRYKFVREAMTLAEFTKLSPVSTVRLGEDPPDGWIGTPDEQRFEVTEAIEPGRKRGDEYKANRIGKPDHVTQEELETRIEKLEPELDRVIQKKAGKYETPPTLLVYLNIVDHGRAEKKIEEAIARQKAKYAASFNGIHVIWKSKLY